MENSAVDNYLHKKFKKQLSVEPKFFSHENKQVRIVEPSEEKRARQNECHNATDNQIGKDNNDCVPNYSTNQNSSLALNSNVSKSSISVEKCIANLQSSNSCISYVVSSSRNPEPQTDKQSSFDTRTEPTNQTTVSTSSILDNLYTEKQSFVKPEDSSTQNIQLEKKDHEETEKNDLQPPPDKISGGKYVCPYCNMVCSKPSVLQKHIRAHTNERPYPCDSCGFSFKTRSNLYKHCRSRTHANRVMGNKAQEMNNESVSELPNEPKSPTVCNDAANNEEKNDGNVQDLKTKPYKPRFHTAKQFFNSVTKENIREESIDDTTPINNKHANSDLLSHHINEIINKNNSIVNSSNDPYLLKKRTGDLTDNEYAQRHRSDSFHMNTDEPLNLTNKNRKRCMSEVVEPVVQKSLIKELLLKNLNSDMQCPHCKMIFQTVTELELHKLRSCKGFVKPGEKYSRSSSVNVASILTQNKNAFDNIPHLQNSVFPLKSPGPFLGKTRLVESDKNKSFSFDDGLQNAFPISNSHSTRYLLSPLTLQKEKKVPVKLFGGEVKITHTSGETKSFKVDGKDNDEGFIESYGAKLSESVVVKSGLQSGGTVLTNKPNYSKSDSGTTTQDVIRVYENPIVSPLVDLGKPKFTFERQLSEMSDQNPVINFNSVASPSYKFANIIDFTQQAVKLLSPNLKQANFSVPASVPNKFTFHPISNENKTEADKMTDNEPQNLSKGAKTPENFSQKMFAPKVITSQSPNICNPMNILVDGKVVRYVPGIPGPIVAEEPLNMAYSNSIITTTRPMPKKLSPLTKQIPENGREIKINFLQPEKAPTKSPKMETLEIKTSAEVKSPKSSEKQPQMMKSPSFTETKKFSRPNTLALKPTSASLKQHHGLTPTVFNQILISPDTPRVAKKYVQQFLHGNYFSYLGLKCSTKSVYCTLNKTQPFYVPHFKKLSMYSEWRQQDTKTDKLYVSSYDSRQRHQKYTTAGKTTADLVAHSSYKFVISETSPNGEKSDDQQKNNAILGGYESNEDYTYIRGRGRGRYVCDQCGIRCKKPSMLKKHIRTHSNDRPYTCSHCNFSFKTKGNLTKHMKSKAHTKNYAASGSGSSTQHSGTQSSDSDTDDSGMDSSDESTRREEHEAAYGLLSLSQKTSPNVTVSSQHARRETNSPPSSMHIPVSDGPINVMNTEEIAYVSKTNYAKNKILDEKTSLNFSAPKEIPTTIDDEPKEVQNLTQFLGKTAVNRPLTYPYTTILPGSEEPKEIVEKRQVEAEPSEPKSIKQFHVIQKYARHSLSPTKVKDPNKHWTDSANNFQETVLNNSKSAIKDRTRVYIQNNETQPNQIKVVQNTQPPVLKVNDAVVMGENQNVLEYRKRKSSPVENNYNLAKIQKNDEVMDLSMATEKNSDRHNGSRASADDETGRNHQSSPHPVSDKAKHFAEVYETSKNKNDIYLKNSNQFAVIEDKRNEINYKNSEFNKVLVKNNGNVLVINSPHQSEVNYVIQEQASLESPKPYPPAEYDNSAMETLADVATKQVKLEKNTLAKSVASEYLKIATKNEFPSGDGSRDSVGFGAGNQEVNELIVRPEGSKSCHICAKTFSKSSQLRLHMNIHYLERPFRCHSCSVSFRTKGHLQKHERSASHHNKLSTSPALSSSEPRPFKCVDCNIAFRIHGHLAKHLRSKMHIMKLECLAKIPFGLYAELERSNSLLTEINTADGDQCLESLKTLAKKVFINDPNKLNQLHHHSPENIDVVDS